MMSTVRTIKTARADFIFRPENPEDQRFLFDLFTAPYASHRTLYYGSVSPQARRTSERTSSCDGIRRISRPPASTRSPDKLFGLCSMSDAVYFRIVRQCR